jgi:hypothetical protein
MLFSGYGDRVGMVTQTPTRQLALSVNDAGYH